MILLTTPIFSHAAEGKSLEIYIEKLAEHPQVLQILEGSQQNKHLADAAMGLPDPVLVLGVDNVPVDEIAFDKVLPSSKVFGFKQQIPSYALRKALSGQRLQLSKKQNLVADFARDRLKALLLSTLIKLDKVKQQHAFAESQLSHYQELEDYFKGRLESGSGVYWRFSEVDVERSFVEQRLNNLEAERDDIEAELVRLVGEVPAIAIPEVGLEEWQDVKDIYPVRIASEDINISQHGVEAAEAAFNPNYGVQALYKNRETGQNFAGDDWFSVQATISIPLWYKFNQEPKKRAALSKKRSAKQAYADTQRQWVKKLRSLESKREAALKNVEVLIRKVQAFQEMVASAKRTYESGETSLDTFLDAKINSLSIQSQLAEQRFKHMSFSAEINSYIGE